MIVLIICREPDNNDEKRADSETAEGTSSGASEIELKSIDVTLSRNKSGKTSKKEGDLKTCAKSQNVKRSGKIEIATNVFGSEDILFDYCFVSHISYSLLCRSNLELIIYYVYLFHYTYRKSSNVLCC